jgi:hypothetical protein
MTEADELLVNLYIYLLKAWTGQEEPVKVLLTIENRLGEYVLSRAEAEAEAVAA